MRINRDGALTGTMGEISEIEGKTNRYTYLRMRVLVDDRVSGYRTFISHEDISRELEGFIEYMEKFPEYWDDPQWSEDRTSENRSWLEDAKMLQDYVNFMINDFHNTRPKNRPSKPSLPY